jgi:glycosyltransferase involved in cell wall biosynthesis
VLGDDSKAFLAPLGTDLELFKASGRDRRVLSRYGIQQEGLIVVYSGSLNARRKLGNLILAFWRACTEVPNLQLIILGEGDDLNHLKSLSQRLSISDRVFFLGYVNYREVPAFLSAADIAVSYVPIFPAFDAQPPLKTIEYLACSLAVIATNTTGNRRFIAHEWNGLLTKDDPKSVSESIIRLSRDARLRETLSGRATRSVENYDWKTIIEERILPAYQETLRM